jgi:hypothetical protein
MASREIDGDVFTQFSSGWHGWKSESMHSIALSTI